MSSSALLQSVMSAYVSARMACGSNLTGKHSSHRGIHSISRSKLLFVICTILDFKDVFKVTITMWIYIGKVRALTVFTSWLNYSVQLCRQPDVDEICESENLDEASWWSFSVVFGVQRFSFLFLSIQFYATFSRFRKVLGIAGLVKNVNGFLL